MIEYVAACRCSCSGEKSRQAFAVLERDNVIYADDKAPHGWVEGVVRALRFLGLEDIKWRQFPNREDNNSSPVSGSSN